MEGLPPEIRKEMNKTYNQRERDLGNVVVRLESEIKEDEKRIKEHKKLLTKLREEEEKRIEESMKLLAELKALDDDEAEQNRLFEKLRKEGKSVGRPANWRQIMEGLPPEIRKEMNPRIPVKKKKKGKK